MPDRCHWIRDDGEDILIPMCMGCAAMGPVGCTCDTPESVIEQVERERNEALAYIQRLREKLQRQHDLNDRRFHDRKRARARIEELGST